MGGVLGVLRLPDTYSRIHAAGLVITAGTGAILLAVLLLAEPRVGLKAVATAGFLLVTAPLVTHVLARAAHRRGVPLGPAAVQDDLAATRDATAHDADGRADGPTS